MQIFSKENIKIDYTEDGVGKTVILIHCSKMLEKPCIGSIDVALDVQTNFECLKKYSNKGVKNVRFLL